MKENLTEIVFLLDRSGSMYDLTSETIGGYNAFIDRQKSDPGEARLTTVLFDDEYEILHNGVNIKEVEPLTEKTYFVRGMTAMCDAIGKTINDVGRRLAETPEEERPSKVIFVITTDGYENASKEFTASAVKEMVKHQTDKYSWEFIFLGANIDAVAAGTAIGIKSDRSLNYTATAKGTSNLYSAVSASVSDYRVKGVVDADALCAAINSESDADGKAYTDTAVKTVSADAALNTVETLTSWSDYDVKR